MNACSRIEVANAFYRLTDWLTLCAVDDHLISWIFFSSLTIEIEMEKTYLIEFEAEQSETHNSFYRHVKSLDRPGNKS